MVVGQRWLKVTSNIRCVMAYTAAKAKVRRIQRLATSSRQSPQQLMLTYIVEACVVAHCKRDDRKTCPASNGVCLCG